MTDLLSLRLGRDLRQSPAYALYMQKQGWQVDRIKGTYVFSRCRGPLRLAKIRRPAATASWPDISYYLTSRHLWLCQTDPESLPPTGISQYGFFAVRGQLWGTRTLLLDLRLPSAQLLASFRPDTRTKLHRLLSRNYSPVYNNYSRFYSLLAAGLSDRRVWYPSWKDFLDLYTSFPASSRFCLTLDDSAGCLVLIHAGVAEYYYAASLPSGRAQNLPYLAAWLAFEQARLRGAQVWDFNGLYDPRWPDSRWRGFSYFKERFAGRELNFSGARMRLSFW